jgi:oxygen-independent coproporphyrinogen III oxidase
MDDVALFGLDRAVPRYTSYPTAAQFSKAVDASHYRDWLRGLPAGGDISLYVHVPYCRALCWYCACHTSLARDAAQMQAYSSLLARELDMVSGDVGHGRRLAAVQLGGGTPTELGTTGLQELMHRIKDNFLVDANTEVSIEIDPRYLTPGRAATLGEIGVTRASLGVQDFSPAVQRAINRCQPAETTALAMASLRGAGIDRINVDLVYGLPLQTPEMLAETLSRTVALSPSRIAVFGYAHVPWMARRQRAIDATVLPDVSTRHEMAMLTASFLVAAGYEAVGIDHFAHPDDPLAVASRSKRMRRNFQGYTDVVAAPLIGLGASAVSQLPRGFAQNAVGVQEYGAALREDQYATARGCELRDDDRVIGDIIERLMCNLEVDLDVVASRHGLPSSAFADDISRLALFAENGALDIDGPRLAITPRGRPATRLICATFDHYLPSSVARHSQAV